ncbi:MAG: glycine cleavage system protein GcvH [Planctomycetota bacterium]|nr:MAG: glycine cleavage system protein GcvH [Planctomycetota bacterium]
MMVDADARYSKSHEWVKKQAGNVFSVGLSGYAVEQLGKIVYVKLPAVGKELGRDEPFGVIESVKSTVELSSPLCGKIVSVNAAVGDNPAMLGKDAYGAGWLIRIEAADLAEADAMMDADAYREFLQAEG